MTLYADRYEVVKYLGKGTSGEVTHVIDTKTGQTCALKTLRDRSHEFLFSFRAEFETLKKINHPNIAKVYDTGRDPDSKSLFFTSEFVDGKNLFDATENMSCDEIEDLFIQSLRALNYLHQFNVVHYDIKPQNFLVTKPHILKLIDFGFANYYLRQHPKDDADNYQIVGTAAYVAPEVVLGEKSDHRSDLYSLACTFYKAFTRELPFSATSEEEVHQCHIKSQAAVLSSLRKESPSYIDAVFLKLMAKKPDDRYATAAAVIEDINLLSGKNYPVETQATLMSYIPTSGVMVGRDAICNQFHELYQKRIVNDPPTSSLAYLVLVGAQGLGKSRLLDYFKSYAQKDFVSVVSWRDFESLSIDEIKFPCLVLGDDVALTTDDLDYISFGFETNRLLVVLATENDLPCAEGSKAILKPFTVAQTREAVQKTTGIENVPDFIVARLHELSAGVPLYLVYNLQALLEKGLLKDQFGSWSDSMVADLASQIEENDPSILVKEHLTQKIREASLVESDWDLLATLALTGKPTMTELIEITNAGDVEKELKILIDKGILKISTNHLYEFAHPLFKDIILEIMPGDLLDMFCNQIADEMESKQTSPERILYFRSFGKYDVAVKALIELADLYHDRSEHKAGIDFLMRAFDKSGDKALQQAILFKLATWHAEAAEYEKSNMYLDRLLSDKNSLKQELLIHSLITRGVNEKNLAATDKAKIWYDEADIILSSHPNLKWLQVLLFNKQARLEYDTGNIPAAEALYDKAWIIWQNDLNPNEQLLTARSDRDELLLLQNKIDAAENILATILKKIDGFKNHVNYVIIRIKLARIFIAKNQIDEGETILKECLSQLKNLRIVKWLYIIYNDLANIAQKKNKNELALNYLRHAFNLAHKLGNAREFYFTAYNLAEINLKLGVHAEAKKYYEFVVSRLQSYQEAQFTRQVVLLYFHVLLGLNKLEKSNPSHMQRARQLIEKYDYLKPYEQQLSESTPLGKK